jgi:hypothetical protein
MNIVKHVSLLHVEASSGYRSRSVIAGSSGRTISNLLSNSQTDFQSGCTSLQSHSFKPRDSRTSLRLRMNWL